MNEQGRIHGNPVADGLAGAVMQKLLGIQKCDVWTYQPTDRYSQLLGKQGRIHGRLGRSSNAKTARNFRNILDGPTD